jgi:hypothetical protein
MIDSLLFVYGILRDLLQCEKLLFVNNEFDRRIFPIANFDSALAINDFLLGFRLFRLLLFYDLLNRVCNAFKFSCLDHLLDPLLLLLCATSNICY